MLVTKERRDAKEVSKKKKNQPLCGVGYSVLDRDEISDCKYIFLYSVA